MEIHQLRYFVAIAEVGSFGGAAKRCHVAQPSLSQQIKKLETGLGHLLFDRLGRSIALTEAGQALLPRARRILADVQEASTHLGDEIKSGHGSLVVGAIPTMAPFLLPDAVERFIRNWPNAKLTVREDLTDNLVRALARAEIDFAIMSTPVEHVAIEIEVLAQDRLLLAAPAHFELATQPTISLSDLSAAPTILLDEVHCLGQQVSDFCRAMKLQQRVVCRAAQLSTMLRFVEKELGVALVPEMAVRWDRSSKLVFRPLPGLDPKRDIAIARRVGRAPNFLANQFLSYLGLKPKNPDDPKCPPCTTVEAPSIAALSRSK